MLINTMSEEHDEKDQFVNAESDVEIKEDDSNPLTLPLIYYDYLDTSQEITPLSYKQAATKIAVLGLPLTLSYFADTICDFLVGKVLAESSPNDFAASQLIQASQVWVLYTLQGQIYITDSLVSKYYGQENWKKCGSIYNAALLFCLLTSIPIGIIFANIGAILKRFGQDEELADLTQDFFYPYLICVPLTGFFEIGQQFAMSVKKQKQSIFADLIGQLTYLFFSYSLVLGKFNFPLMGMKGWGFARAIQSCTTVVGFTAYLALNNDFKKYELFSRFSSCTPDLKEIFQLGWPVSLQMLIQRGEQFFLTLFTGSIGVDQLRISGVISRYLGLLSSPQQSLSVTNTILIGQLNGSDSLTDARIMGQTNKTINAIWSVMVGVTFIAASKELAHLFLEEEFVDDNETYIRIAFLIAALGYFADSLKAALSGALRGLEDTKSSMLINIFTTIFLSVPLTILMSDKGLNAGLLGLLGAYNSSTLLSSYLLNRQWSYRTENTTQFTNKDNFSNPFRYTFFKLPKKVYAKLTCTHEPVRAFAP